MRKMIPTARSAAALGLTLFLAACGGSSPGAGSLDMLASSTDLTSTTSSQLISCDYPVAGNHVCYDYTMYPSGFGSSLSTACMNQQGVVGTGCSHSGTGGGCETSVASTTTIIWHYGVSAADVMGMCTSGNSTYVAP